MNECKDCRFWNRNFGPMQHHGVCSLLSGVGVLGERRRAAAKGAGDVLITRPDFGCSDWKEKPLEETVRESGSPE